MGTFPSLPALQVRPPTDPIEQLMRISSLQGAQQQQQLVRQQIQDQSALTAAMRSWDGKDINDLYPLVLTHGGSAQAVLGLKNTMLAQQEKFSQIASLDAATGAKRIETMQKANDSLQGHLNTLDNVPDDKLIESAKAELAAARFGGYIDQAHAEAMDKLIATNDPTRMRPALDLFRKGLMTESQQLDEATKTQTAQGALMRGQAAMGELDLRNRELAAKLDPTSPLYSPSTAYLAKQAAAGDQNAKQVLAQEINLAGAKAGAEAKAKLPYDLALKQAELDQNPAIAVNPQTGQREWTTFGEARAKGFTNPVKVTSHDEDRETEVNTQLRDMQMNTSRYKAALNAMANLSEADRANIQKIVNTPEVKDILTGVVDMGSIMTGGKSISQIIASKAAGAWSNLSADKQQAVIGYLRMKNTGLLAQKVLTGMGRASKEALDIELANMPSPIEGATVGNQKLDAWQENLDQMNARSVKLPWMEGPQETKARIEREAVDKYNAAQAAKAPTTGQTGQIKIIPGQPVEVGHMVRIGMGLKRVTKVYPDGTFDVE